MNRKSTFILKKKGFQQFFLAFNLHFNDILIVLPFNSSFHEDVNENVTLLLFEKCDISLFLFP